MGIVTEKDKTWYKQQFVKYKTEIMKHVFTKQ